MIQGADKGFASCDILKEKFTVCVCVQSYLKTFALLYPTVAKPVFCEILGEIIEF